MAMQNPDQEHKTLSAQAHLYGQLSSSFAYQKVKETSLQLRVSTTFLLQMVTPLLLTLANIIEAAWFTFDPAYLIVSWQYLTSWCMTH